MSAIDDGGPAFPEHPLEHDHYWHPGQGGMTLRDWFAGQALPWCLANKDVSQPWKLPCAIAAYEIADAMIAARKGGSHD